jgi:hypothetical protein
VTGVNTVLGINGGLLNLYRHSNFFFDMVISAIEMVFSIFFHYAPDFL